MDENQIVAKLQQNIPQATESKPITPVQASVDNGNGEIPTSYDLDEITQYKLLQHFGEDYKESDPITKQQLSYIYEQVAQKIGTKEYPFVIAKINELKRILGLNHTENARSKMYQWLKLDQQRSKLELQMDNVRESI